MRLHQININYTITINAAKTLAQILVSAQGLKHPVQVKVVSPTTEHLVLLD
ncbi:hypothetical protein ACQKFM_15070 [Paenibacillus xylanexedens]|uniref:hypothetical protein n=1 Tax=Paenibacillus xylanexedens TaxID=528191 RepID=UPI003CFCC679